MLRLTNAVLASALFLAVSSTPAGHQAVFSLPAAQVADGSDPIAPPYPLAVPGKLSPPAAQVADGSDPIAPPYPLAVPRKNTMSTVA
jgi:hypothetical protein